MLGASMLGTSGLAHATFPAGPNATAASVEPQGIRALEIWLAERGLSRKDAKIAISMFKRHKKERQGAQNATQSPPVMADGRAKGPQHQKSLSRIIAEETGVSLDTVKRARGERIDPPITAATLIKDDGCSGAGGSNEGSF